MEPAVTTERFDGVADPLPGELAGAGVVAPGQLPRRPR
jgi:hypothetical protein